MIEDKPKNQDHRDILLTVINATCSRPLNHGGKVWAVDEIDRRGMSGSVAAIEETLAGIARGLDSAHQATGCDQPLRLTLQACPKKGEIIKYER